MFLFEQLIKLLVHYSESLLMGFMIVLVAYNGWMLRQLLSVDHDNHEQKEQLMKIDAISKSLDELDDSLYREVRERINELSNKLTNTNQQMVTTKQRIEKMEDSLSDRLHDKTEEIKDTLKILLSCYRGIEDEEKIPEIELTEELKKEIQNLKRRSNNKKEEK